MRHPLESAMIRRFAIALARSFRWVSIAFMAVFLVAATVVSMALLLEPELVRPVVGYSVAAILAGLFCLGAWRFRRVLRGFMILAATAVVLCGTLNLVLLDGLLWSVLASLGRDETVYAENYSAWRFWRVTKGMSREQVVHLLGEPLVECWVYAGRSGFSDGDVSLERNKVTTVDAGGEPRLARIQPGMTRGELLGVTGPPSEVVFCYTQGRDSYRERVIVLRQDHVMGKNSSFYMD